MKKILITASALALGWCATGLHAQDAQSVPGAPHADKPALLEEIVITAQHRRESAQKTPLAVTVLSGEDLAEKGVNSSRDLINTVPGLALTSTTPNANISLRGIGSGGGNQFSDPTVAFNLDGVSRRSSGFSHERISGLTGLKLRRP